MPPQSRDERRRLEHRALQAAQLEYLDWLRGPRVWPQQRHEPRDFNRLSSAAREMLAALDAFDGTDIEGRLGANRDLLLFFMQDDSLPASKDEHEATLARFIDVLRCFERAKAFGTKSGPAPLETEQTWVWMAADGWLATVGEPPAAGDPSAFVAAMVAFERSPERDHKLPAVTVQRVRTALRVWAARRVRIVFHMAVAAACNSSSAADLRVAVEDAIRRDLKVPDPGLLPPLLAEAFAAMVNEREACMLQAPQMKPRVGFIRD